MAYRVVKGIYRVVRCYRFILVCLVKIKKRIYFFNNFHPEYLSKSCVLPYFIQLPNHRVGSLFVLQNSIFRISEKLLNRESGHALITKSTNFFNQFVPILLEL